MAASVRKSYASIPHNPTGIMVPEALKLPGVQVIANIRNVPNPEWQMKSPTAAAAGVRSPTRRRSAGRRLRSHRSGRETTAQRAEEPGNIQRAQTAARRAGFGRICRERWPVAALRAVAPAAGRQTGRSGVSSRPKICSHSCGVSFVVVRIPGHPRTDRDPEERAACRQSHPFRNPAAAGLPW